MIAVRFESCESQFWVDWEFRELPDPLSADPRRLSEVSTLG